MSSTIRRLRRSVQKVAKAGGLSTQDAVLSEQIVECIARTGKCHLSEVARMLGRDERLIETERELSEQLGDTESSLDGLSDGWLRTVASVAASAPSLAN